MVTPTIAMRAARASHGSPDRPTAADSVPASPCRGCRTSAEDPGVVAGLPTATSAGAKPTAEFTNPAALVYAVMAPAIIAGAQTQMRNLAPAMIAGAMTAY